MTKKISLVIIGLLLAFPLFSQENSNEQQLDEVVITSSRIDMPFKENSRAITIITSEQIKKSAATNVADLLQEFAGVDIRRRGVSGMQSDLYIRGGGFDQTLLLIDGFKVEDPQTGHHNMNMILPLDVIERIEIIKGPAARVFGQNAFTGAINIVTKKNPEKALALEIQAGSFGQKNASVTVGSQMGSSNHLIHFSRNTSDGYRYNTDFDNQNYFLKSNFNTKRLPITMLATFSERKFGANGFYASPSATDQYEETQASLLGFSSNIIKEKLTLKPRLYWKRNQDEYVFVRQDPSIYRNLHQSNKVAAELDGSYTSNLGTTGFGMDVAQVYISSNNLGQHNRLMSTLFLEHRFQFFSNTFDVTPGIAATYYSDFKFHAFPGVDMGYKISDAFKVYGNVGYTFRIPTYTDLYYSDPTTLGNENLDPEEAIAEELGIKLIKNNFSVSLGLFNRDSNKVIDYVKENENDLWQATNIRELNTKGFEVTADYNFKIGMYHQFFSTSYSFLEDDVKDLQANFSRYSINSLKHHYTSRLSTRFFKNISQNIVYKYAERASGESYSVVDASLNVNLNALEFSVIARNIFNTEYTETNLVPMPKGNVLFSLKYVFK
ncbi:MAG TPA: TonB-dependent receptor [Flavobacteriaceae bacterium]|nr:TonB-dependent receptor [Flavobacteriaceae bacterium]